MSGDKLTRESAAALVDLVRAIRPAWDARAILNALGEVRDKGDVAYVAYRVLKTALTVDAATPKALTFDAVWAEPDTLRRPTLTPPRLTPGEFTPDKPIPSDEAKARIAALREIVRDNPPPKAKP